MESQSLQYKGYTIKAHSYELTDEDGWNISITIFRDKGDEINARPFSTGNVFPTKAEAIKQCFEFGRKIVDGEIPGFSVLDL